MRSNTQISYLTMVAALVAVLASCGSSFFQEREQAREAERQEAEAASRQALRDFAEHYGATPVDLFPVALITRPLTLQLQVELEQSAAEVKKLDIQERRRVLLEAAFNLAAFEEAAGNFAVCAYNRRLDPPQATEADLNRREQALDQATPALRKARATLRLLGLPKIDDQIEAYLVDVRTVFGQWEKLEVQVLDSTSDRVREGPKDILSEMAKAF